MNLITEDYYKAGDICITPDGYLKLGRLVNVVINRHYNLVTDSDKEDLYQEGLLKGLMLLHSGNFDPARGKIYNFLYTGIRNEMGNYLYRIGRSLIADDSAFSDILDTSCIEDDLTAASLFSIPNELIKKYSEIFDIPEKKIRENLHYIGFDTGKVKAVKNENTDMVCVLIIHEHLRKVRG